ncbi:hypothetical protein C6P76_13865 [Burkholderia multivorans]|uniref:glycan biosynthesis hexose transferase WsfD n=1 Tax=Burkholderia multivorans TaxID=87883 RepID=UPI000CFE6A6F|nr:hypothetical protein [Burkholderia multivorans]PRD86904.1 hypothetical protein C6P76_13865 [Burkholderia multivorans]
MTTRDIIATILFILTIAKAAIIFGHSPMIGYANNFDFARSEACIGIWQHYSDQPKDQMHISASVSMLMRDGDMRVDMCSKSIDNVIPWIIGYMHPMGTVFGMQEIGLARVALLAVLVGWLLLAAPSLRLPIGISFFLVFGDIAYLSYFNTLYNETSILIGAFMAIFAIVGLTFGERRCLPLAFIGLTLLGLAKMQYAPLAIILSAVAFFLLRDRRGAALFTTSLILFGVFCIASGPDVGLRHSTKIANNTDTYLGAVLPSARDKLAAIRQLGLPDDCLNAIGITFYSPGVADNHPCPDVVRISRIKLLPLFAKQPTTLLEPITLFVERATPMYLKYMGRYENPIMSNSRIYNGALKTSATSYLDKISPRDFRTIMLMVVATSIAAAFLWRTPGGILIAICGLVMLYTIGSGVFGDGYFEAPKHGTMLGVCLLIQAACIVEVITKAMRDARNMQKASPTNY